MSPHIQNSSEGLLKTSELAAILGIAEITVRKWRISGHGPRFVRCGRNIRYSFEDVLAWVAARTVASTSEEAAS